MNEEERQKKLAELRKSAEACDRMIASWPKWKQEWAKRYMENWHKHIGEWD